MEALTISALESVTGGKYYGDPDIKSREVTAITSDSRTVTEGCLFAAIKGERADGFDYIPQAIDKGALCALSDREAPGYNCIVAADVQAALRAIAGFYRKQFHIPFVGIVGSVGKTTSKEMTAAVLSQKFNTLKTEGNFNNELGVPLTLFRLRPEHEAAVIEMGISDFGEMTRLAEMVRPNVCLMTVIGQCHLENLGDLQGVLKAKSEVFDLMSPDSAAVLNGDDETLKGYTPPVANIIRYGKSDGCEVRGENIVCKGFEGTEFDIVTKDARFPVTVHAYGEHIVTAALGAAAVGLSLGLSPEEITRGLESYAQTGGRSNVIDTGYITIIDDCYNANPNSVANALRSLSCLPGRKVAILGDMLELGAEEKELHRNIGLLSAKLGIDSLICCGRLAEYIYKGHIASGSPLEGWHFPMKDAFFSVLPSLIKEGDRVLVKASHGEHFEEIVEELKKLR
ncbi:MAG: UDP-N-acetylmuramoyl-tripeptide--D-alanyl-D-alanine ligase [Oscillospiraceae bacterium]|nr:UDP-N-acetylmuramoyl-tripeptide--D-alanyl-D-alanine ligase [Oscillospiraceae bacterium]